MPLRTAHNTVSASMETGGILTFSLRSTCTRTTTEFAFSDTVKLGVMTSGWTWMVTSQLQISGYTWLSRGTKVRDWRDCTLTLWRREACHFVLKRSFILQQEKRTTLVQTLRGTSSTAQWWTCTCWIRHWHHNRSTIWEVGHFLCLLFLVKHPIDRNMSGHRTAFCVINLLVISAKNLLQSYVSVNIGCLLSS